MTDDNDLKSKIMEILLNSPKPRLYLADMNKLIDAKPRAIKNAANALVKEGKAEFWSSGSTTMYTAKGRGKAEENHQ